MIFHLVFPAHRELERVFSTEVTHHDQHRIKQLTEEIQQYHRRSTEQDSRMTQLTEANERLQDALNSERAKAIPVHTHTLEAAPR
jgi:predicted  nucleic acid-binding Zn-ribbon protein